MINIDKFREIDLRVGKIIAAERVGGSEKLIRLEIDCGDKDAAGLPAGRQVVAGIGKKYAAEELVGKEIIVVANLEPRQLMGLESQGMLLAADGDDGPVILRPDTEVSPGTNIC